MKRWIVVLTAFFMAACANLYDGSGDKTQRFEEKLAGQHAALAACVTARLQSDGRSFLRPLQFKNRQYPDIQASEIHAYDTRFLHNAYSTYAPSNPDGILFYGEPTVEVQSPAQRSENDRPVYAFALFLQKIDDKTVDATLKGEPYTSRIAWEILQRCVNSPNTP